MPDLSSVALPLLRRIEPERAHRLALLAIKSGMAGVEATPDPPVLAVQALGCRFVNPIGLAAGFDKDAMAINALLRLGFGFAEFGTVTPQPQPGNPRPRLFRLIEDGAVINRMGMNGRGLAPFLQRLRNRAVSPGRIGVNVGLNKEGADPERDYPALVAAVSPYADYIALNVSSPNTPGLRDLQAQARLRSILQAIHGAVSQPPPIFVKIAPDLADVDLRAVVETSIAHRVQGLIVSNTTVTRPADLMSPHAGEAGGLSGSPLFNLSTQLLARTHLIANDRLVLIGCGGVATGRDVLTKLRAGASLVQLYTAFAYGGPALIRRIKSELAELLHREGFASVQDVVGVDAVSLAQ